MNNGILSQDVYGKIGFSNNLPQPLAGSPGVVQLPYHFPPNNEWRKNLDQCLVLVYDTSKQNNLTVSLPYGVQSFATDIIIDWGDGLFDKIYWTDTGNSRSSSHTYSSHGIYTVIVSGRLGRLGQSVVGGNFTAITKCLSFGNLGLVNLYNGFGSFSNLIEAPTTIPSGVTDISFLFNGCTNFNDPKINYWNTSNIANMSYAFTLAINFNQPLNNWNTNSVTTMYNMFTQAYKFNQDLSSWNMSGVNNITQMFYGASSFNNGGSSGIMNWNISSQATNLNGMFYLCTSFDQPLDNWNVSKVTNMNALFQGASVFNNGGSSGINNWNTSSATTMQQMFQNASSFNQNLDNWNVRKVTNFTSMFNSATNFNGSLSGWAPGADTSGTNCTSMFQGATKFVGSGLGSWDTSKVTTTYSMFDGCTAFNTSLDNWDVRNVSQFRQMFQGCTNFNSSLANWQPGISVSGGAGLFRMFNGATSFNQPLSSWNISNVTDIGGTFAGASSFNQDLSSWNTSKVTSMSQTFLSTTNFNNGGASGIGNWNTSNVTNMNQMFQNSAFNQPIGSWDTSNVTNMQYMFYNNFSFNQPINSWNVSKVNTMFNMFGAGALFNQDISGWNLAGLNVNTALDAFMNGKAGTNALSTANYNTLLIGWNNNKLATANGVANWRTDLRPNFGGAKYTAGGDAAAARAALVSYGWTITDGGTA